MPVTWKHTYKRFSEGCVMQAHLRQLLAKFYITSNFVKVFPVSWMKKLRQRCVMTCL